MKRRILACVQIRHSPPSEKIWEREKQKQTIYGNVYRNAIKDGDSQTSLSVRFFLFSGGNVFSQARRIYKEISEISSASSGLQARILNPKLIFKYLG